MVQEVESVYPSLNRRFVGSGLRRSWYYEYI